MPPAVCIALAPYTTPDGGVLVPSGQVPASINGNGHVEAEEYAVFFHSRGDLNCDGAVDFNDINPFVLALSDPVGYSAAYPDCIILNGDCDNDGAVDFDDINAFVALLSRA